MIISPMPLTIDNVQFFKKTFLKALSEKGSLSVDMSSFTDVDLAGIQLLVALLLESRIQKKEINFTGIVFPGVQIRLQLAGFNEDACGTGEMFGNAIKAACQ